jgi:hypothetical protein
MAMFPDSGVPPADAKNSLPDVRTLNCDELWYSTSRCQPRFDPAAANAMLAEQMNLIMQAEMTYNCTSLNHIESAVRYIAQRGLTHAGVMYGGPYDFVMALDPPLSRYNDWLVLLVYPTADNIGYVRLNVQGHGSVPVWRNDGTEMLSKDLKAYKPTLIAYLGGAFYHIGLCASQVPIVKLGGLDAWIRTDGNDTTGDGTANTPDKAFKTIPGCWNAIGSRYAASPSFSINMRLGIPGTYDGTWIGPFGGSVSLTGDINNRSAYKLRSVYALNQDYANLVVDSMNMTISGICFQQDTPPPWQQLVIRCINGASVMFHKCQWDVNVTNDKGILIHGGPDGAYSNMGDDLIFNGLGQTIRALMYMVSKSSYQGTMLNTGGTIINRDMVYSDAALVCGDLAQINWGGFTTCSNINTHGKQYNVYNNSILNIGGQPLPGTVAGTSSSGGQVG